MSARSLFVLGVALCLAFVLAVCSGEGPKRLGTLEDGKIVLKNETGSRMRVNYVDKEMGETSVVVEARETKDISPIVKGGTKVTLGVQAFGFTEPSAEIPVTIDGDVIVQIVSFGLWGADELEYRIQRVRGGGTRGSGVTRVFDDGRIFLRNETARDMDVTYVHEELGQIDTTVKAGETGDISQAVLKGGAEVTVKVEAVTSTRPWARIKVTIDGNVTIRITSLGAWGANALEYVIQ